MKMTKKFDSLNDAFDIAGEVVSKQIETNEEKIEDPDHLEKIKKTIECY